MTAAIQWSNPKQQGFTRSIDAFYKGTSALESFDLSLMFPPGAVTSLQLSDEAAGWTIFSNKTDDGNFLIAGILNPGLSFKPDQKLFTLAMDSTADSKNAPSFLYSGNVNATSLAPTAYEPTGNNETPAATERIPLQSSKTTADPISAWLDKSEGLITSVSDAAALSLKPQHFTQLVTPLQLKIKVNQAASEATMRLYLENEHIDKGFWVQSKSGEWFNLVSDAQGGQAFNAEPGTDQAVYQFKIQDGGKNDADGQVDGQISLVGIVGHIDLNLLGRTSDLPQANLWL